MNRMPLWASIVRDWRLRATARRIRLPTTLRPRAASATGESTSA